MVQPKKGTASGDTPNGAGKRESNMSLPRKDATEGRVASNSSAKVDGKAPNGNRTSFRTDASISNSRAAGERVLKPWVPDSKDATDGSLEKSSGSGTWDQFAENERLFGLKTDYDENIYTTAIDRSHPNYQQRMVAADKKAREIERSVATTAHVAEERVMDFVGGDDQRDEEEKYSGVRRQQDFPPLSSRENKYIPPSRRAPTGQATVKGAPVDPAIISSQLKAQTQKQLTAKTDDSKNISEASKTPTSPSPDLKAPDLKVESNANPKPKDAKATEIKATIAKQNVDAKVSEKSATPLRPSNTASRTISPQARDGVSATPAAPSATSTVERDVLKEFKTFATQQRLNAEKARSSKAKADKEDKLTELKKFADSFKLSTPVPQDLISIIAKDPAKQKEIQAKAILNAEEKAKTKAAEVAAAKQKEVAPAKVIRAETLVDVAAAASTTTAAPDSRTNARPTVAQHSSSPSGLPNRHPNARQSYANQPHFQQGNYRNRPSPNMNHSYQQTGNLAQRIRDQKMQHPQTTPSNQHVPGDHARLPPTGPANNVDPTYSRRSSGLGASHFSQGKLNPNSHEFRPNAFAPAFNPAAPSQSSSPRSSVNNPAESQAGSTPVGGQLIRRKAKAVDAKKCCILIYMKTLRPQLGRSWDDNDGFKPSFDTLPTWRQLQEGTEKSDSNMHLTYKEYFEKLPPQSAAMATPNQAHVMPQLPHQHQLPFHLQHGAHNPTLRQSPHMPPMQTQAGPHAHLPHAPFNNTDEHRMMPSGSAQSFASPRMNQVPIAYQPAINPQAQMPYNPPVLQPYMATGTPMTQFRSFSNSPQFIPQQGPPPHMAAAIMVQPQFISSPNGMIATAGPPQVQMYSGAGHHPHFMAPGASGLPNSMPGSNGYPSPGRSAAPMMVHQGSHQGQQAAMYGMSPGMQYQQPVYIAQGQQQMLPPANKFSGPRPQ